MEMALEKGRALQIVSTSSTVISTNIIEPQIDSFHLIEEHLEEILAKVPTGMKISIVSVVGAFRTGKSFLLNFFLRYLRHGKPDDLSEAWMTKDGMALVEGNMNEGVAIEDDHAAVSFAWRGGQDRQTTGIWMWSEPFVRIAADGESVAVLLMDTQGMFDNDTSMALTAQIFGLSTFVSSYQIYNVDKRLQEDNLQHLALFSEYGRLALRSEETSLPANESSNEKKDASSSRYFRRTLNTKPPFQRIQFLVRDWQNFSEEWPDDADVEERSRVFRSLRESMKLYLDKVLKPRDVDDLQSTRDQILRCFDNVDCFLLPHPGIAVTKRNFSGTIGQIDPFFRALINRYVREVFDARLEPKLVHGRSVGSRELLNYFRVFVSTFQASSQGFPKAMTLLDATAEANNRNALDAALDKYKTALSAVAGEHSPYQQESAILPVHTTAESEAMRLFDERAGLGSEENINQFRSRLEQQLQSEWARYRQTNWLKNPYRDLEQYIVPVAVTVFSWAAATVLDLWCVTEQCEFIEDTFERICAFMAIVILIFAYSQTHKDAALYTVPVGVAVASFFVATVIGSSCNSDSCVKTRDAFRRVYLFLGFGVALLVYKNFSSGFVVLRQSVEAFIASNKNVVNKMD